MKRTCRRSGRWGSGCEHGRGRLEAHREEKRCGRDRTGARLIQNEQSLVYHQIKGLTGVTAVVILVVSHDE
jgi:hypothetical protein